MHPVYAGPDGWAVGFLNIGVEQVRISGFRNPLGLVHNAVVLQEEADSL